MRENIETEVEKFVNAWNYHTLTLVFEMVRRHNEELALSWERAHGFDKFGVAKFIREASPK